MNVQELIDLLEQIPVDKRGAPVKHLWDGMLHTEVQHVYLGKTGVLVTADYSEIAYENEGRPEEAPSKEANKTWYTPANPNPELEPWEIEE